MIGDVEICGVCSQEIRVQIFKGTGLCSERCRKRAAEWAEESKKKKGAK